MKKLLTIILFLVMVSSVSAQWWSQNDYEILNKADDVVWVFLPSGQTSQLDSLYFFDLVYGADGDTTYSEIYLNVNDITLDLIVNAPASVLDSVNFKVNLYTGDANAAVTNEAPVQAAMIFNRTLDFNWGPPGVAPGSRVNQAFVDSTTYWHTDVGRISYRADTFIMLEVITNSGHAVVSDSVNVRIKARGKLGRGE